MRSMPSPAKGAVSGAAAALAWVAVEPLFGRALGTPYGDSKLAGALITRGRFEPVARLGAHTAAGALFGWVWAGLGGRGAASGVLAAELENALLWPAMAVVDRVHPLVRDGTWPSLLRNPRAFGAAAVGHGFFGAVLGALAGD
jgi:hypothetical protein